MPSRHLILCRPLLLLPPIPPSIRVFSNESTLHIADAKITFLGIQRYLQQLRAKSTRLGVHLVCFRTSDVCPERGTVKTLPTLSFKNQTCCGSVAKSCATLYDPHWLQHTMFHCPSPFLRVCSNSCSLSWWCHPTISSSVVPFSSWPQSFPASGSFLVSR